MHGKYNTADWVLSVISVIGWFGVVGGAFIVFKGLTSFNTVAGLALGGAMVASSLFLIAMAQIARAQIDTAQTNAEMLALMQKIDAKS